MRTWHTAKDPELDATYPMLDQNDHSVNRFLFIIFVLYLRFNHSFILPILHLACTDSSRHGIGCVVHHAETCQFCEHFEIISSRYFQKHSVHHHDFWNEPLSSTHHYLWNNPLSPMITTCEMSYCLPLIITSEMNHCLSLITSEMNLCLPFITTCGTSHCL